MGEEFRRARAEQSPAAPRGERGAEQKNFLFLLEKKMVARAKSKIVKKVFSARQAAVLGCWRRGGAIGFSQKFLLK